MCARIPTSASPPSPIPAERDSLPPCGGGLGKGARQALPTVHRTSEGRPSFDGLWGAGGRLFGPAPIAGYLERAQGIPGWPCRPRIFNSTLKWTTRRRRRASVGFGESPREQATQPSAKGGGGSQPPPVLTRVTGSRRDSGEDFAFPVGRGGDVTSRYEWGERPGRAITVSIGRSSGADAVSGDDAAFPVDRRPGPLVGPNDRPACRCARGSWGRPGRM